MRRAKVSIITRTRDRELFLARAMQSVLGQVDPPAWEWIVVNDAGDPDKVESVLQPALQRHADQVTLVHLAASTGMEHASNAGIAKASGELLVIHDDDDSWDPLFLKEMSGFMNEPGNREQAGVVCHSIRIMEKVEANRIEAFGRHPFNSDLQELSFWEMLQENRFPPISFLFRRSLYDTIGPFNESLPVLGDWEFNLRALARFPLAVLPQPLAFYHHRPELQESAYANTITADDQRHRETEIRLRESWAHENPFGLDPASFSHAARMAGHLHRMKVGLRNLDHRTRDLPRPPAPQF